MSGASIINSTEDVGRFDRSYGPSHGLGARKRSRRGKAQTHVGIASFATVLGETLISPSEIAAVHGVDEATFNKWLGDANVYATEGERDDLALRASKEALLRAGIAPSSISMLATSGCSAQRLQHALDATNAFTLEGAIGCSELLPLMWTCRAMLAESAQDGVALVAVADKSMMAPLRAFGRMSDLIMRDVFSDGAAVVVLTRKPERLRLLGLGCASDGKHWDYFERFFRDEPIDDRELMRDTVPVCRAALQRCLENVELPLEAFDFVLFPLEGPRLTSSFARMLGVPQDKAFRMEQGPTHVGASDPIFALESLLASGRVARGSRVLVAARAVGLMRFIAIEV